MLFKGDRKANGLQKNYDSKSPKIARFTSFAVFYWLLSLRAKAVEKRKKESAILGPEKDAVFCGKAKDGKLVFIKPKQRSMHTQVVGTTNAGKTESVILPWAIQDMEQGRGLILIDGKSDRSLLEKLRAYAAKAGRSDDFKLFSLASIDESFQINPLIGGTTEEIALEFELSRKEPKRYRQMMISYVCHREISAIIFITDLDVIKNGIRAAIRDTYFPEWDKPVGFASLKDVMENPMTAKIKLPEGETSLRTIQTGKKIA